MSIIHALKWSFLSEIASKAIQPLVFVILARLLTPDDYGVVAAAAMVISFSQIFWEAGMGKAIIQYQGDRAAAASVAFWINNVMGVVVAGVLVAISGGVADRVFHDPRVALVLRVMALQVFLSASVAVHVALLQKDMQFKHLFWVRLATVAVPGLASIPLAWYGMGYWALVAGVLVGQTVQVAILWKTSPWRPHWCFDWGVARQLGRFGGWVAASGLLAWFYTWADSLIVGMYLGSHELGLYRTGNAFVAMIYGFLFGPLMPVFYSHLSGIQHDRERVRANLFKIIKIITFISIPLGFILYVMAQPIADFIFGKKWSGISLVISILALTHGFAWVVGANAEAFRSIGKPDIETKAMFITMPIYLLAYLSCVQFGLEAFLYSRFAMVFIGISVQLYFLSDILEISVSTVCKYVSKITLICLVSIYVCSTVASVINFSAYKNLLNALMFFSLLISLLFFIERNGLISEFSKGILRSTNKMVFKI